MLGEENMERILSDWLHNLPVTWMAVLFFSLRLPLRRRRLRSSRGISDQLFGAR